MELSLVLDLLGTIAFAISGVLTAFKKRMDLFGIFIIAFVTAAGGGTLRDILIQAPITWMRDLTFVYVIAGAAVFALIFRKKLGYLRRSLFLFDTIGIALYTVVGVQKGFEAEFPFLVCVALGTITASFGGVIRDLLCNEIPVIFRKEIYATACIVGGSMYYLLRMAGLPIDLVAIASGVVVMTIRLLAVWFKWSLPNIYSREELNQ